jgi:hypothetical protein
MSTTLKSATGSAARLASRAIIAALAITVIAACSSPSAPTQSSSASGQAGSLTVSVPSIAPWLAALKEGAAAKAAGAKAFAYLSYVKISVLSGSQTLATGTIDFNSTVLNSTSLSVSDTLYSIPAGSYTVKIEGYNYAVSTSDPVVSGSKDGVVVTEGASTSVWIGCAPTNWLSLDGNAGASNSASIAASGEKWYKLGLTSGTTYYISQDNGGLGLGLFKADGNPISQARCYLEYTATADSAYLVLASVLNTAAASSTVSISTMKPELSEGSALSPVDLTVGESRAFKISASSSQASVYRFRTSDAGSYSIALDDTIDTLSYSLYSDSTLTPSLKSDSSAGGFSLANLSASTSYYLTIYGSAQLFSSGSLKH